MKITDELRKALGRIRIMAEEQDGCSTLYYISPTVDELTAIADRIDAEHDREMIEIRTRGWSNGYDEGFASADDWLGQHEDAMAEHGWVKLPVDADGVPWRVGDVTENGQVINSMGLNRYGWYFLGTVNDIDPSIHRHYHEPTVEDVLREFAQEMNENMGMYTGEAIDADEWRDADARTVEKYAERLELREVGA